MLTIEESDITINDLFISYTDDGNENDAVVISIHGFPLSRWEGLSVNNKTE